MKKEIEETILLWQRDNLARNLSLDSMETYASSALLPKEGFTSSSSSRTK